MVLPPLNTSARRTDGLRARAASLSVAREQGWARLPVSASARLVWGAGKQGGVLGRIKEEEEEEDVGWLFEPRRAFYSGRAK